MSEELLDDNMETAEAVSSVKIGADKAVFPFQSTNSDELAEKVQKFLSGLGYKLEEGNNKSGIYGKGSKILRILLGAFVKRFTWGVKIEESFGESVLTFTKNEKGYWGGLIGVTQVSSEYKKITSRLEAYHQKHHSS